MCFLISAAVRASTSSRSSEAFTSSPICVRVASTSSDTSEVVEFRMGSVCVSGGFMLTRHYIRPLPLAVGRTIPRQANEGCPLAASFDIVRRSPARIPLRTRWELQIRRNPHVHWRFAAQLYLTIRQSEDV